MKIKEIAIIRGALCLYSLPLRSDNNGRRTKTAFCSGAGWCRQVRKIIEGCRCVQKGRARQQKMKLRGKKWTLKI